MERGIPLKGEPKEIFNGVMGGGGWQRRGKERAKGGEEKDWRRRKSHFK